MIVRMYRIALIKRILLLTRCVSLFFSKFIIVGVRELGFKRGITKEITDISYEVL